MQLLETSILKTLAYFDVFDYPLTTEEIVFFLDQTSNEKQITPVLQQLVDERQLWKFEDFYSVRNDAELVYRRVKGNNRAATDIKKAMKIARFLSWFPYIRGLALSGSLSKHYADENSDIDFFIITAANRLWFVRAFYTILYKIVFVLKIKDWFCLNYFIDEIDLKIEEENIFTAVEISTLLPLKGKDIFKNFFDANDWVYEYQPNYKPNFNYVKDASPVMPKRIAEWLFNFEYGNRIDNRLQLFFKKRFAKVLAKNIIIHKGLTLGAVKAEKHACKPIPQYFQPRILTKFNERFAAVEKKYSAHLGNKEKVLAQKEPLKI